MMNIALSNIVTAFDKQTIGAKVVRPNIFWHVLYNAVEIFDFNCGKTPGQAVIDLMKMAEISKPVLKAFRYKTVDDAVRACVHSGIARKTKKPTDFVCRSYRGQVHLFRKRYAGPVNFLRAVVYTKDGYLKDPDVVAEPREYKRIKRLNPSHVLVAVLASEVESFVSPYRFVANLAGGNLDYAEGKMSYRDLVSLAQKVKAFDDEWIVVAD